MPKQLPKISETIFRGDEDTKSPSSACEGQDRLEVSFDNFVIVVELTPSGQFIGISEVRIRRDFLSHGQRMAANGVHDVEEFYKE